MPSQKTAQNFGALMAISAVGLLGLLLIVSGLCLDEWWTGFGLVLFMTSLIAMAGTLNAPLMEVVPAPAAVVIPIQPELNSVFFPKGAIAFFVAMIVFFGMVWLGLYGLMIYRHNI